MPEFVNRLIAESSPYLLDHAHDPVNWYCWSTEAIDKAKAENKPIFLSLGYFTCHWCQVMHRESFSSPRIAAILNKNFICIKVDREERPDIDEVYIQAGQLMTEHAGWPLNMFLTPQLVPFFGGTYFPPESVGPQIGFAELLEKVAAAFRDNRSDVETGAATVLTALTAPNAEIPEKPVPISAGDLEAERSNLLAQLDPEYGGFGRSLKFPRPAALFFLLEESTRTCSFAPLSAVDFTLRQMAAGGIRDHLAGGFHRYTVDRAWRLPHFEKNLPDNALLARAYLRAWLATGDEAHLRVATETLDFLLTWLAQPDGGFYSALDAASDGEEGRYYLWSRREIESLLPADRARRFCLAYGISLQADPASRHVLAKNSVWSEVAVAERLSLTALEQELSESLASLRAARACRTAPRVDRKVITAWNGLAIGALAEAGALLGEERYLHAARVTADLMLGTHRPGGRLIRHRLGTNAGHTAFLDDYAFLTQGLLELYNASLREEYLIEAGRLAQETVFNFPTPQGGLFYAPRPGPDEPALPVRPRQPLDGALLSPEAVLWESLLRLSDITGDAIYSVPARRLESNLAAVPPAGAHYARFVASAEMTPRPQVAFVGPADAPRTRALAREARRWCRPGSVLLWAAPGREGDAIRRLAPSLRGKGMNDHQPTAYIQVGRDCLPPITDAAELRLILRQHLPPEKAARSWRKTPRR